MNTSDFYQRCLTRQKSSLQQLVDKPSAARIFKR